MTVPPPPPPQPPQPPQPTGQQSAAMVVPRFYVKQRITMMINRYEIRAANPDGSPGAIVAFAEQKRMKLKEEVVFYADDTRRRRVFSFKARQRLDVHAEHDVFDEYGTPLGAFRKDFGASLLRSTFHVEGPGFTATGQERSQLVAVLRRFTDIPFLPIHFDFVDPTGRPVLSSERQASVRDKYTVQVPDERVDFRLAAAVAVGLDALMQR